MFGREKQKTFFTDCFSNGFHHLILLEGFFCAGTDQQLLDLIKANTANKFLIVIPYRTGTTFWFDDAIGNIPMFSKSRDEFMHLVGTADKRLVGCVCRQ